MSVSSITTFIDQLLAQASSQSNPIPTEPPSVFPAATPLTSLTDYQVQTQQASTVSGISWSGVARIVTTLLSTGISIYDAVQVSQKKAGYLPSDDYLVAEIRKKYPNLSDTQIQNAILNAQTRPSAIQVPAWLDQLVDREISGQRQETGVPIWVWVIIAVLGFMVIKDKI